MGEETKISWCDATFNPWWGCTHVGGSPACHDPETGARCYAETWAKRTGFKIWGQDADRRYFGDKHWAEPLKWDRAAERERRMRTVFVMSMGDWAEGRPEQAPHLERLWDLQLKTRWLIYLMLTKRPQLITKLCPLRSSRIWHGTTAENQHWLDIRWPFLRAAESEVYWLSMEPLYGHVTLPRDFLDLGQRAWCIVGGQSGPGANMMNPNWVRHLRDQCVEAHVPFHFKQWGEVLPDQQNLSMTEQARAIAEPWQGIRVGKAKAGAMIDGREWREFPAAMEKRP